MPAPVQQDYTPGNQYPEYKALIAYLEDRLGMSPPEAKQYATQILNFPESTTAKRTIDTAVQEDREAFHKTKAMMEDQKLSQFQQYGQLMMAKQSAQPPVMKPKDAASGLPKGKR